MIPLPFGNLDSLSQPTLKSEKGSVPLMNISIVIPQHWGLCLSLLRKHALPSRLRRGRQYPGHRRLHQKLRYSHCTPCRTISTREPDTIMLRLISRRHILPSSIMLSPAAMLSKDIHPLFINKAIRRVLGNPTFHRSTVQGGKRPPQLRRWHGLCIFEVSRVPAMALKLDGENSRAPHSCMLPVRARLIYVQV